MAKVASAPSCRALYDSGVKEDGAYPISITTPDGPTTRKLYCDMKNGGWTLIGQVAGKAAMYDGCWVVLPAFFLARILPDDPIYIII